VIGEADLLLPFRENQMPLLFRFQSPNPMRAALTASRSRSSLSCNAALP
jgi:hypothetical protein